MALRKTPEGTIVWILGAGFSKAVGGPLLPQLLSKPSRTKVAARFGGGAANPRLFGPEWSVVERLLDMHGWMIPELANRAWGDAEQFLEFLDLAAEGRGTSPLRRELVTYAGQAGDGNAASQAIAAAAKRMVGAECCFFEDSDLDYEKWSPYLRWAGQLGSEDAVVTFNYDRVVEAAAEKVGRPVDLMLDGVRCDPPATKLLKLHGSVDWRVDGSGGVSRTRSSNFVAECPASEIAIGTPGPSKARFAKQMEGLWTEACEAIREAATLVLVGYRFPPTDATAREKILEAIASNTCDELNVYTVLGPDRDAATNRLEALLRDTFSRARRADARDDPQKLTDKRFLLNVRPLFAEDFLGLATRHELLPRNAIRIPPSIVE